MSNYNWDELYRKLSPRILGICRRYVMDIEIAENIMHDAFVTAIEKNHLYNQKKGSLEVWIKTISINNCINYINREKNRYTSINENLYESDVRAEYESEEEVKLSKMNWKEEQLLELIDQLPDTQKQIFNMYVVDGFSHKKIAEVLSIPENTSKSHLLRAKKNLQKKLTDLYDAKKTKNIKVALFLLLPFKEQSIQWLFKSTFSSFSIKPIFATSLSPNASSLAVVNSSAGYIITTATFFKASVIVSLLTVASYIAYDKSKNKEYKKNATKNEKIYASTVIDNPNSAKENNEIEKIPDVKTIQLNQQKIEVKMNNVKVKSDSSELKK